MDELKIRNFTAAHPGIDPPKFRHLSPEECGLVRGRLNQRSGLSTDADGLEILRTIEERAIDIPGVRPSQETFSISNFFRDQKINAHLTFINWYRFDDIDEIDIRALDSAFHDIWYPGSDDIEILDESFQWIVLVRHFDVIQICRF